MKKVILVTGGLGFIGSHLCVELIENNYYLIIIDNLSNSSKEVKYNMKKITKYQYIEVQYFDIVKSPNKLRNIFIERRIDYVIHMAGLKSVNESIKNPLKYYNININSTLNLLKLMNEFNCKKLLFSSSATVYGNQHYPVNESDPTGNQISNTYGKTKYMIEEILKDLYNSDNDWSIVILRYFNPIGAHPSGYLGENPKNTPNNLFPYLLKVANNEYSHLNIYGNDYNTSDGTCLRDYIHITDLVHAHCLSLSKLNNHGLHIYNVGTGNPVSVLELLNIFMSTNNIKINYKFADHRLGDLPIIYADCDKIKNELGFIPKYTIEDMCRDGYNYIKKLK